MKIYSEFYIRKWHRQRMCRKRAQHKSFLLGRQLLVISVARSIAINLLLSYLILTVVQYILISIIIVEDCL